jgi:predicted molibdopterin-dependent oxidoreductase YjgC
MTRRTGNVDLMTGDVLEIHPDDAATRGLDDGGLATVSSRVGEI